MATWTPERIWEGQEAFVIGGGASLCGFDFSLLIGRNTIGVNDAYRLGPAVVKVVLFSDAAWFQRNKMALERFAGLIVSLAPALKGITASWLKSMDREMGGLHRGSHLGWNFSTGATAVNLAISLGAATVYLLGIDLVQVSQKTHWHSHRDKLTSEEAFIRFRQGFATVYRSLPQFPGVKVINVTDGGSSLPHFERKSFAEVFPQYQGAHCPDTQADGKTSRRADSATRREAVMV